MRSRNFIILLVLAGALIAGWWVTRTPRGRTNVESVAIIPKLNRNQVSRILIEAPGTSVTLTRRGEQWFCDANGHLRADADAIRRVFDGLENLPPAKVISKDPAKHAEFKVDKLTGWRVRMITVQGAQLFDVVIGKRPAQEILATYARPYAGNTTYQVDRDLTLLFDRPGGWRNKLMFEARLEDLSRIQIETTTYTIVLAPKKAPGNEASGNAAPETRASSLEAAPWVMVQPIRGGVREEILNRIANMVMYYAAFDLEDNAAGLAPSGFGLAPPFATITFARGESGKDAIVLKIGEPLHDADSARARYATVSGDPQIYILLEETLSVFFMNPSEYRK